MEEKYGWYSHSMAEYRKKFYKCYGENIAPYSIYLDSSGKEVKTTLVTNMDLHRTSWEDMVPLGIVTEFIRHEFD